MEKTLTERMLELERMHFARLWARRHVAGHVRESVRANIRAQRATRAYGRRIGDAVA